MKHTISATIAVLTLVLTGCQSTPTAPVIKRANSTYETTGFGKSKTVAQQEAIRAAKKQCGIRTPIILKDNTTYRGIVDEHTGRLIDKGIAVVSTLIGNANQSTPKLSGDDDYEYAISFQCQ